MGSDKRRVEFHAPTRLIDQVDTLAAVRGEDRTDILLTALREYLREMTHDDAHLQEIAGAYYDDEISYDQLSSLVGSAEGANHRVLKQQLSEDYVEAVADL